MLVLTNLVIVDAVSPLLSLVYPVLRLFSVFCVCKYWGSIHVVQFRVNNPPSFVQCKLIQKLLSEYSLLNSVSGPLSQLLIP